MIEIKYYSGDGEFAIFDRKSPVLIGISMMN